MKKTKGLILKLFLYQIVMSFFGVMLYSALQSNELLKTIALIVSVGFFWFIIYLQTGDFACKIAEKDIAHSENTPLFSGFLCAFLANIPTFVLSVISLISKPSLHGAGYISFLINKLLLQGMHMGISQYVFPTSVSFAEEINLSAMDKQVFVFIIGSAVAIIIAGISFIIGYKRFNSDK